MAQDKASLTIAGTTLLEHQQQLLHAAGVDELLISGSNANGIADNYPGRGPLAGLHSLLKHCQSRWMVVIAVDMPMLTPLLLRQLISQTSRLNRPCHFNHHYLPLCLPVQQQMVEWLEQQLAHQQQQRCSVRRFCQQFNALALDCEHPHHLTNTNTPAQWQACLEEMNIRGHHGPSGTS